MLVPNSNTEYRALIGDRDADDTTDLSDNASDDETEVNEVKSDIKRVLESKHIIGGKSKINEEILDFEPDSLTSMDGVMEFDSLDGSYVGDDVKTYNLIDAVNNEVNNDNDKQKIFDNVRQDEIKSVEGENHSHSHNSILMVGIDSGPLNKAEFAVEEIHRSFVNGKMDDLNLGSLLEVHTETIEKDNYDNLPETISTYKGNSNVLLCG